MGRTRRVLGWLGVRGLAVAAAAAAVLLLLAAYASFYRLEGYYGPVYGSEGRSVYFVQRNVVGLVWGLGIEFFTPPAHVYTMSDRLALRRMSLDGGSIDTLLEWTTSPVVRRRIDQYRGGLFGYVRATVGFTETGEPQVTLEMQVPQAPTSESWWAGRMWNDARREWVDAAVWQRESPPFAFSEGAVLSGDWELMTLRGGQALPAAMVAYNHVTREVRVLARNREFRSLYPEGPPVEVLERQSRRADIERVQEITRVHDDLVARFRGEGMSEWEALLRASKEMQRLGYFPKSPTLTARLIVDGAEGTAPPADDGVPTFDISEMEFTVGLFPDIEEALDSPGTAVDKRGGDYIIHRDYTTSARLNEALRAGATKFRVRARGRLYELTIERP